MKGALVNIRKGTYGAGGTALTASNLFVFDSEVGGINSVFTYTTDGLVPAPTGSGTIRYLREDGAWGVPPDTDSDTWIALTGTVSGYVTAQGASDTTKFLNGNGQWSTPPDTNTQRTNLNQIATRNYSDLQNIPTTFTPSAHFHNASDINAGTLAIARIPTGTTSTTVALGDHNHFRSTVDLGGDNITTTLLRNSTNLVTWYNHTGTNVNLVIGSGWLKDDEIEGSYTGTGTLPITGASGVTILVPDDLTAVIPKNGVYGIKFIANNIGVLFGTLIPA